MNAKNKINGNFPNLRFPEFTAEWERKKLGEVCKINPRSNDFPDAFIYIDLESVANGSLLKENFVVKEEAPSRAQRVLSPNDILFQLVRPYQKNNLFFDKDGEYVASTGYAQIRTSETPKFIFQYLHNQRFVDKVIEKCTGTSYPAINSSDLGEIEINYPASIEQQKIASFLSLIDERIQTQKKIIEEWEYLLRGVYFVLFTIDDNVHTINKLHRICKIKKGEQINNSNLLEAGAYYVMNGGVAPSGYNSEYNSEGDTISISEGGNSCGYVQYNTNKFWSGGHCYTLEITTDKIIAKYLYHYLKFQEDNIMRLRVGSGLPNIQKKDLENVEIKLFNFDKQKRISEILDAFLDKLQIEKDILINFQQQKKYLLQNLFI